MIVLYDEIFRFSGATSATSSIGPNAFALDLSFPLTGLHQLYKGTNTSGTNMIYACIISDTSAGAQKMGLDGAATLRYFDV